MNRLRRLAALHLFAWIFLQAGYADVPIDVSRNVVDGFLNRWATGADVTLQISPDSRIVGPIQWYHDGQPISGATGRSLKLASATSSDSGDYWALVTTGDYPERSRVAAINIAAAPPSSVDPTFTANVPSAQHVVWIVTGATDDSVLVLNEGYQLERYGADGSRDDAFASVKVLNPPIVAAPDGSFVMSTYPWLHTKTGTPMADVPVAPGFDASVEVTAAAVQRDGKYLLAQRAALARYNPDGTLDATFHFDAASAGITNVSDVDVAKNGAVYCAGSAIGHGEVAFRLNSDGSIDFSFAYINAGPMAAVRLHPLDNGAVVLIRHVHLNATCGVLRPDGTEDPNRSIGLSNVDFQPTFDPRRGFMYNTEASVVRRYKIDANGISVDPTFFASGSYVTALAVDPDGRVIVSGLFASWNSHPTVGLARLLPDSAPHGTPDAQIAVKTTTDGTATLHAMVQYGEPPFTIDWVALDGQRIPPENAHAQTITFAPYTGANSGRYQVRVTNAAGSTLSQVVELYRPNSDAYLLNLSARAQSGTGDNTMIGGVSLPQSTSLLVRAGGPALHPYGVDNVVPNPSLWIFDGSGRVESSNDDWSANPENAADVISAGAATGAFPFAMGSLDAAKVLRLPAGTHTFQLQHTGADGVGLLEVYAVDKPHVGESYTGSPPLASQVPLNLSLRTHTAPGDATAIAGLVVGIADGGKYGSARVLLRAIGPSLAQQGVSGALADPQLRVFDAKGQLIAENDDWMRGNPYADPATIAGAAKQVGAFALPPNSKDSAVLLDLNPGAYTLHATGGDGIVLLEIYLVP